MGLRLHWTVPVFVVIERLAQNEVGYAVVSDIDERKRIEKRIVGLQVGSVFASAGIKIREALSRLMKILVQIGVVES